MESGPSWRSRSIRRRLRRSTSGRMARGSTSPRTGPRPGFPRRPASRAFPSAPPGILCLGTVEAGVFRSVNGGATWVKMNDGLDSLHVVALGIDPVTPATLYAGTNNRGIYKSANGGVRWQASSTGLSTGVGVLSIRAFAIDPRLPSKLFAATDTGVYESEDGGAAWQRVFGFAINALAMDPGDPDTLYAGYGAFPVISGGLFRSTQSGAAGTWEIFGTRIPKISIASLAASPAPHPGFAGRVSGGIEKKTDRRPTWPSG